jgi:hypothetical protein
LEVAVLHQDRLRLLLALYDRRLVDVAAAARIPVSSASELVNCRRQTTTEQLARLEAAIVGAERLLPHLGVRVGGGTA